MESLDWATGLLNCAGISFWTANPK